MQVEVANFFLQKKCMQMSSTVDLGQISLEITYHKVSIRDVQYLPNNSNKKMQEKMRYFPAIKHSVEELQ